jgi:hypothetical protein
VRLATISMKAAKMTPTPGTRYGGRKKDVICHAARITAKEMIGSFRWAMSPRRRECQASWGCVGDNAVGGASDSIPEAALG